MKFITAKISLSSSKRKHMAINMQNFNIEVHGSNQSILSSYSKGLTSHTLSKVCLSKVCLQTLTNQFILRPPGWRSLATVTEQSLLLVDILLRLYVVLKFLRMVTKSNPLCVCVQVCVGVCFHVQILSYKRSASWIFHLTSLPPSLVLYFFLNKIELYY